MDQERDARRLLARRIGWRFSDERLRHALVHRSYVAEHTDSPSNERLEFLGDAVLGLVVTEELFARFPDMPEGDLARIRAAVVSTDALAPIAAAQGVGEALLLGRGESTSGGRRKDSLLADALEALIGATFLEGGLSEARPLVLALCGESIDAEAAHAVLGDPKNRLQELVADLGHAAPVYDVEAGGPDHERFFRAVVHAGGVVGHGQGRSKKRAERLSAEDALGQLETAAGDAGRITDGQRRDA